VPENCYQDTDLLHAVFTSLGQLREEQHELAPFAPLVVPLATAACPLTCPFDVPFVNASVACRDFLSAELGTSRPGFRCGESAYVDGINGVAVHSRQRNLMASGAPGGSRRA
jgi:hypothetical protein